MAQHDVEIGKIICSTNAVESLNGRYRRAIGARGHFPTAQAALKLPLPRHPLPDPTGRDKTRWAMRWKPDIDRYTVNSDSPDDGSTAPPVAVTRAVVEVEQGDRALGAQTGLRRGRRRPETRVRPGGSASTQSRIVGSTPRSGPAYRPQWVPTEWRQPPWSVSQAGSPGGVQRLRQVQLLSAASGN